MNYPYEEKIARSTVHENESIKAAMRAIDNGALGIAFIVNAEGKFIGVVTDGDVRRATLQGVEIGRPIKEIANTNPIVVSDKLTDEELLTLQNREPVRSILAVGYSLKIPVLDSESKVKDIIVLYYGGEKTSRLSQHGSTYSEAVKKVLVIGCAGYLGSVLTRKLISSGYIVSGLDNLMYEDYGIRELYGKEGFNFIEGDIRDIRVLTQSAKGCDAVIHLAAIVGDPACKLDAEETISINYLATKMITEVCKYSQINRFLFASTCSVYGANETPGVLITEDSALNPLSLYAKMKIKSEKAILEAMDDNFSPTILRMATLYGLSMRMRFDLVVNLLTAKATTEGKIAIFGGEQWRPLLHVDDAAEAYIRCLETPLEEVRGQILNVGSKQQNYRISELGTILQDIIPNVQIENIDDFTDVRNYSVDFDKISNVLGYKVERTIQDGIIEIKHACNEGKIGDYTDKRYSNYESLSEQL
ncbi:NAD-dependent epimerase/dehydratase family protein [Chloroflexota bacterium]